MKKERIAGLEHEVDGQSKLEYFYSEKLKKYVSLGFLHVDERVTAAALELGIKLDWDDEGRICNISYTDARRLLDRLGSSLLTPSEFWKVYEEAKGRGEPSAVEALESNAATEWLDVVFERNENGETRMIEHPRIGGDRGEISGEKLKIDQPYARPGWFDPKGNIDGNTGFPVRLETKREKGTPSWSQTTWKYWSTFKVGQPVAGIRGYVTSSGTPSLDLDIPVEARLPVLMIRECRDELVEPELDADLARAARVLVDEYLVTTVDTPGTQNPLEHEGFYDSRDRVIRFMDTFGEELFRLRGKEAAKLKEKFVDMLGVTRLEALRRGDRETMARLDRVMARIFPDAADKFSYASLAKFLSTTRERLARAGSENQAIVFVMGHKNPDTDTVISSLFEAYRKSLAGEGVCYVPVVQAERIPDEIRQLLGEKLAGEFMLTAEDLYREMEGLGQTRWILVDHNRSEKQKFALSIVDHHILSAVAENQDVPRTWEMVGSCSAQIAQKLYGMGATLDRGTARLLHGATLMDTENRGPKKMTTRDKLIMDTLKSVSGVSGEGGFYQELMSHLLNTDDPKRLFERDYKEDWGIFGFAVAKVKNVFDGDGNELKGELLRKLVEEADRNNKAKNFCMTIVKVVDYEGDNETVNRERIYLVFNSYASREFRQAMFECLERIVKYEFGEKVKLRRLENAVEFWGVGDQLSRKVTAPKLEPVVDAFNEYFHSEATGLYVRRDFLERDEKVEIAARDLGIDLYVDKEGRVCNITFDEAKRLVERLGMTMMSLPEYWQVYGEVYRVNDVQMQAHLVSGGFVEFLDTVFLDHEFVVNHPEVRGEGGEKAYHGERVGIKIPEAYPALIYPEEIDGSTGLPTKIYEAQEKYADLRTWRYWSPDADVAIPTRGHIFLLKKPALDSKIHPDDALPNLGIRVAARKVAQPRVEFEESDGVLEIKVMRD